MTSTAVQPSDVRHDIRVYLDKGERYDVRLTPLEAGSHSEYGEVRFIIFTAGSLTATEYVARRRKRTGEAFASASPREVPVAAIPEQIRRAARMALLNDTFPLLETP